MRSQQLRPCKSPRFDGFAIGWSKRRDRKSNRPRETRPLIASDSAARKCLLPALGRRRGCSSKGRLTDPKPAVGARLRIFPLTPRHPTFPAWSGASESGGFLPFPICLARDVHTLKTGIYYRPLRSPCPRADAARVGIQRDVPVKIWWHLVMLGSDRLKRADTVPDTTIRMRSENRDFRQLHCLETVSPRRAGELRDRGLHEPVSAGPTGFAFAVNMSPAKNAAPGSRTYQ